MGAMARICFLAVSGSCASLAAIRQPRNPTNQNVLANLHFGVDNPVEVLFSLVLTARSTLHGTEQSGPPFDAFIRALGGLFSLPVFNLGLFVRCRFVIASVDRLDCFEP